MTHPFESTAALLSRMPAAKASDIFMPARARTLVYLIHGVTGTPAEMKYVGRRLWQQGFDVYLPSLPGHCSRFRDLLRSNEKTWLGHVETQLAFARKYYDSVFAAGLSAGALLALQASTRVPLEGVGVLSPTLFYDGWNVPRTQKLLDFGIHWFPYGIKNPALQGKLREAYNPFVRARRFLQRSVSRFGRTPRSYSAEAVGYPLFFLKTLADLDRLYTTVKGNLYRVTAPTLIMQACEDDFTSPKNAAFVYQQISSSDKRLVLLDDCYHVVTVDRQRDVVARELKDFIFSHLSGVRDFARSAFPSGRVAS
jgi:carboxylesterase